MPGVETGRFCWVRIHHSPGERLACANASASSSVAAGQSRTLASELQVAMNVPSREKTTPKDVPTGPFRFRTNRIRPDELSETTNEHQWTPMRLASEGFLFFYPIQCWITPWQIVYIPARRLRPLVSSRAVFPQTPSLAIPRRGRQRLF